MAIGKYISLEEARKTEQLERFAKEHPSKEKKKDFDALDTMAKANNYKYVYVVHNKDGIIWIQLSTQELLEIYRLDCPCVNY